MLNFRNLWTAKIYRPVRQKNWGAVYAFNNGPGSIGFVPLTRLLLLDALELVLFTKLSYKVELNIVNPIHST